MVFAPYIALGSVAPVLVSKQLGICLCNAYINCIANMIIAHNYEHGELAT